jgi:hypothetical protein
MLGPLGLAGHGDRLKIRLRQEARALSTLEALHAIEKSCLLKVKELERWRAVFPVATVSRLALQVYKDEHAS